MALTDPSGDLQAAITAKLLAVPEIAALVADRIFDRIPSVPAFPYLSYGNTTLTPELGDSIDAAEAIVTIHSWDRFGSSDKVMSLGALVIAALHDSDLSTTGSLTQSVLLESANYLKDPDGLTNHGVFSFSVLTEAN